MVRALSILGRMQESLMAKNYKTFVPVVSSPRPLLTNFGALLKEQLPEDSRPLLLQRACGEAPKDLLGNSEIGKAQEKRRKTKSRKEIKRAKRPNPEQVGVRIMNAIRQNREECRKRA
jgi:hypothetical protein